MFPTCGRQVWNMRLSSLSNGCNNRWISGWLTSRLHNDQHQTMTGVLAALGAAMAWTGASALWRSLSGRITAIRLNAMKNGLASLLFLPVLLTLPHNTEVHAVLLLLISG